MLALALIFGGGALLALRIRGGGDLIGLGAVVLGVIVVVVPAWMA